ncbi:Oxoglutarate/iron-dependent dioxygenase [Sesbania bispinosa]|nr:Oxoglutarate/iron-dependent dioxygenase [Sesbania bispinosa]
MDPTWDPPLQDAYKTLLDKAQNNEENWEFMVLEECELPVIDLSRLEESDGVVREECKSEIAKASQEWGFFQIVNHGISSDIFNRLRCEQEKMFKQRFDKKTKEEFLNLSPGSYRWGTPTATCIGQLSWSEAFHIPLADILGSTGSNTSLSSAIEQYATIVSGLAQTLADILAEKMGHESTFFKENCLPNTCFLRLNRYPPCPTTFGIHGLVPHTDSDFLTILYQDHVGGLQLVKDGKWIAVKPNPGTLIVNIGDLFQAWSNGVYKSVKHRVMTNPKVERKFSFREYRQQVQDDVQKFGTKIGLPRFQYEGTM